MILQCKSGMHVRMHWLAMQRHCWVGQKYAKMLEKNVPLTSVLFYSHSNPNMQTHFGQMHLTQCLVGLMPGPLMYLHGHMATYDPYVLEGADMIKA